jgi:hypothetical protein
MTVQGLDERDTENEKKYPRERERHTKREKERERERKREKERDSETKRKRRLEYSDRSVIVVEFLFEEETCLEKQDDLSL